MEKAKLQRILNKEFIEQIINWSIKVLEETNIVRLKEGNKIELIKDHNKDDDVIKEKTVEVVSSLQQY